MPKGTQKELTQDRDMEIPDGAPQPGDGIRLPHAARFDHEEAAQNQNDKNIVGLEDVFPTEDLACDLKSARRERGQRISWFDMNESEVGDFPYDDLTGLQTSSPEELSDSAQPAFFSVRSYHQRARRLAEFARIDSSLLSRPLSAPPRSDPVLLQCYTCKGLCACILTGIASYIFFRNAQTYWWCMLQ